MKRKRKPAFDPKVFQTKTNGGRTIVEYRANDRIFVQGEAADTIFYIKQGKIKLSVISKQGKEVVAILKDGDFFGEGCLAGQPVRMATAKAMSECSVMKLEKAAVISLLHEEPSFSELFVAHLLSLGTSKLRRIWLTNCLIPARKGWHECCCCWQTSARKANRSRSSRRSVRRRWRALSVRHGQESASS